jgi:hypothetical protein
MARPFMRELRDRLCVGLGLERDRLCVNNSAIALGFPQARPFMRECSATGCAPGHAWAASPDMLIALAAQTLG